MEYTEGSYHLNVQYDHDDVWVQKQFVLENLARLCSRELVI